MEVLWQIIIQNVEQTAHPVNDALGDHPHLLNNFPGRNTANYCGMCCCPPKFQYASTANSYPDLQSRKLSGHTQSTKGASYSLSTIAHLEREISQSDVAVFSQVALYAIY